MTSCRTDDPEGFDATPFRSNDPALRIGYKEASLSVRGVSVFIAIAFAVSVGATVWSGRQIEATIVRENGRLAAAISDVTKLQNGDHAMLRIAQDRTSCLLTMTQEHRAQFRARYHAGAFRQECPWIGE